jgi:hypothetical protein
MNVNFAISATRLLSFQKADMKANIPDGQLSAMSVNVSMAGSRPLMFQERQNS